MSPRTAEIVLYLIAGVGLVVWIIAFEFLRRITQTRRQQTQESMERFQLFDPPDGDLTSGELEVKGLPGELSARFAAQLARGNATMLGPVQILEADERCVRFESTNPLRPHRQGCPMKAEVAFRPAKTSGHTEIAYLVETRSSRRLMTTAWIIQSCGLVMLIGLFWWFHTHLIESPNPGTRTQVIQLVQTIHLLWPPFLLGTLSRTMARVVTDQVRSICNNLPYA